MSEIIAVDVGGVVLDLHKIWLQKYNKEYNDTLSEENILRWETHEFVKTDCGLKIYDYIKDPSIYKIVPPIKSSIEGIKFLKLLAYRIIYVTHSYLETSGAKYNRLLELGFLDRQDDYIECKDKSLIKSSYLIDDNAENIKSFSGIGIIFTKPWNKNDNFPFRVDNWHGIIELFKMIEKQKTIK